MYGLIGKMVCVSGRRDELAKLLLEGTRDMPGCLSYLVLADTSDDDALWVVEAWRDRESHEASRQLPAVQAAMRAGRPLISEFAQRVEARPLGGQGLPSA